MIVFLDTGILGFVTNPVPKSDLRANPFKTIEQARLNDITHCYCACHRLRPVQRLLTFFSSGK